MPHWLAVYWPMIAGVLPTAYLWWKTRTDRRLDLQTRVEERKKVEEERARREEEVRQASIRREEEVRESAAALADNIVRETMVDQRREIVDLREQVRHYRQQVSGLESRNEAQARELIELRGQIREMQQTIQSMETLAAKGIVPPPPRTKD